MNELNQTHDAGCKSWVTSANAPLSDFPLQNLPFGVFSRSGEPPRGGVAIGEEILDLRAALDAGLISEPARTAAAAATGSDLNPLLALDPSQTSLLRAALFALLNVDGERAQQARAQADKILVPIADATLHEPVAIGAYTDFCCSLEHVQRMAGGTAPRAFFHLPIGYNGRASSLRVSGTPVQRPLGQYVVCDDIRWGPEPMLDFELEFAAYVSASNELGTPVRVGEARRRLFGYCLLNDWSARGTQFFESILGPFLGKSFQTSISPWIVTAEALAPFKVPARVRALDAPALPPHLSDTTDQLSGGLGIELTAFIRPAPGPDGQVDTVEQRIVTSAFREMYWTFAQMLAHHTSNGCDLRVGDLLASGTVSGPQEQSMGCLAELTRMGTRPLVLENGQTRCWLQDGDEITLRGRASRPGFASIGFGDCTGRIVPGAKL